MTELGELGATCHPRERLGGDENSAMIIERPFGVVSVTRNLLNQFAIGVENSRIGTGKMNAFGMISQCLMAHAARHSATFLILHQEPDAILFQVLVLEARERHLYYLLNDNLATARSTSLDSRFAAQRRTLQHRR